MAMKFYKSPLVMVMLRFGLIAGALITLLMIGFFYLGQHPLLVSPYLDFRILLFGVFIYFGVREFREVHHNGLLYFWQGMIGSYLLVFISMLVASAGVLIFSQAEPRFVSSFVETYTTYLKSFAPEDIERIGKQAYEGKLASVSLMNGMQLAQSYFIQGIVIGLFVGVILSAILRKQPKTL